jgi:hypothetical protein
LVESESFSLEGGLELVDCGLLHRICNFCIKGDTRDHNSFNQDSFVG